MVNNKNIPFQTSKIIKYVYSKKKFYLKDSNNSNDSKQLIFQTSKHITKQLLPSKCSYDLQNKKQKYFDSSKWLSITTGKDQKGFHQCFFGNFERTKPLFELSKLHKKIAVCRKNMTSHTS